MRTYRRLTLADIPLLLETQKETKALDFYHVDTESVKIFLSNPSNYFFACIDNNKIIGYICGHELNRLDNAGNMLYIHAVGVHADFRQQGIGKQMMDRIKQLCKHDAITKIFLYTKKTNKPACALYDSCGGYAHCDDNVSYFFTKFD